jgi:hypothetical protein
VVERNLSSLAFDKPLTPEIAVPAEARLKITVIFTSVEATVAALKAAASLAASLSAQITLLVPQVVPYPAPLATPPVLVEFSERKFRVLASQSPVPTRVQIYLCRDALDTLKAALTPHSTIVLGGRRRWWATKEERLARRLRKFGHEVIFAETE